MLATTTTRFGALGARGLQLQTALTRTAAGTSPLASLAQQFQCSSRTICTKIQPLSRPTASAATATSIRCQFAVATAARRSASTTASTATTAAAAKAAASEGAKLDWNTFFTLRKTRRLFQLLSSIITTFVGGAGGAILLMNQDLDFMLSKIPMDPFISLGLIVMSFAGLGWLAGPSLGSAIFYTFKRGVKSPMGVKEAEFFSRVRKNRADPTASSMQNPVPDFYGEKISSVAGYRQWLKDQRAFKKKQTSFV